MISDQDQTQNSIKAVEIMENAKFLEGIDKKANLQSIRAITD